jgi:hypothetical protein
MTDVPCCLCGVRKPDPEMFECLGQFICDGHEPEEVRAHVSFKLFGKLPPRKER